MADEHLLQIGDVAERVGLSLRTLRYYEEVGLLTPDSRTQGGFRLYASEQVDRIALIKQMKPLGFTVQEMRELLDARDAAHDESLSTGEREAATARLKEFATATAGRIDDLRQKLEWAEDFAGQLRRETRRGTGQASA
jgi:DNA-binding transcriptional MerR regulator